MARSLSEAATYVLQQIEAYGVKVSASSRLASEFKAVCNNDGSSRDYISKDDSRFETALEALRDFRQLEFFFDAIEPDREKDKYAPIISRILSDSVLPQHDARGNSRGRDAQAEAFAFAVCKNAGMNPLFTEPDITCEIDGEKVGIAVKRIKTLSQSKRRLKEAARQIHNSTFPGIISMEVTLAVNPNNYSIVTNQSEEHVRRWWRNKLRTMVDGWDRTSWQTLADARVLGVLLHEHCPVRLNGDYKARSMTYGISTATSDGMPLWLQFRDRFIQGLPNLQQ